MLSNKIQNARRHLINTICLANIYVYTILLRDAFYKCTDTSKEKSIKKYTVGISKNAHLYIEEHLPRTLDHTILLD